MTDASRTLTIHLGAKVPSKVVAYKMIEASVTIQDIVPNQCDVDREDHEALSLICSARRALAQAFVSVCDQMGESPPDELRADIEAIYGVDRTNEIYAD